MEGIAIIGLAGRFPGAKNIAEFWQNLCDGVEAISQFNNEELIAAGVEPSLLNNPNYIKAGAVLEDIELFDANFFGFNPKEAEMTDPQHRLFLECAWEALENAGYDTQRCDSRIGVYAGASLNNYLSFDINSDQIGSAHSFQKLIGIDKDFLTTRVSYKLNLTGPSLTVQTACSTSLVATALACQSLLNYQCDMALAGGTSIRVPQKTGYLHQEGGILSPDGHCRAFDAKARGTIIGNGVGVVLLKRLSDAIADGDHIYAVIKGSAINNDGSGKVGYTAPSVNGQAEAIAEAIALADVDPETITYIETHGTGTALGDPIEISALTNVFRAETEKKDFCAIGSVKTNIGHLDAAAGVTGLIKTALALQHKLIPPSLNFEQPNPEIDFANSPFYVNTQLKVWETDKLPRRAGVSSLGIGGTNAHVILEEAPALTKQKSHRTHQLLLLSAKTELALATATKNLAQHLMEHSELNLADVAYTLQVGRREFNHRCMVVCNDMQNATTLLETQSVFAKSQEGIEIPIIFMFPGQGAQYVNMARELYESEFVFREQVDNCAELLQPLLGLDLRHILYPVASTEEAAQKLQQTAMSDDKLLCIYAQPALFAIEYAFAQLWMSWGVHPQAAIGHSIGEYVAATIAGVFSLEEALVLVAKRGQLMQQLPPGAMLSVSLPATQVQPLLNEELSLAANNAPNLCVVSGTKEAIAELQNRLNSQGIACRLLHTSHAFHSQMMNPIINEFTAQVSKINLKSPQIPFISSVTGTWITAAQATDPSYWARHLRQPVQFSAGIQEILQDREKICLEVGPGRTLSSLVKQHSLEGQIVLQSNRHPHQSQSDVEFLLTTLGQLWLAGVQIDWSGFYAQEQRHRVPLPTYPFERQRYWIESLPQKTISNTKKPDLADWFYIPSWKQTIALQPNLTQQKSCWLIFIDGCGVGEQIAQRLEQDHHDVITVIPGEKFAQLSLHSYTINPRQSQDYHTLLQELQLLGKVPNAIAHFWSVTQNAHTEFNQDYETSQYLGFYSLLFLAQAIGNCNFKDSIQITVVSNHLYEIIGTEQLNPQKATVLGCCKVIPQEYANITCRSIDIVIPSTEQANQQLIDQLRAELTTNSDPIVAYRGKHRWLQNFEPVRLEAVSRNTQLKDKGVYLITGGLGGIGLALAEYLAKTVQARLVLVGRSALPPQQQWSQWLATHDEKDTTSLKIQKVQALEKLGAQVLVISADVANLTQMQQAIAQTLAQFGQINGVIHAAGIAGGGMIQLKTPEIVASVFAPKVQGTLVLAEVIKNQNIHLDFLVLCSSLSAILGDFGQVDYCAANTFLDVFAHYQTAKFGWHTVAINWDAWQDIGMAVNTIVPNVIKQQLQERLKQGIISTEGIDVFSRVLEIKAPQIIVSDQDLQAKIQNYQAFAHQEIEQLKSSHSYPIITREGKEYVAPENEIQQQIAEIWQEIFGIKQISIHDDFFDLGGHSLLAVQILSRLREKFSVEIALQTLLSETPTIAELAQLISDRQLQLSENQELESLLAEIESLSISEIEKQLAAEL